MLQTAYLHLLLTAKQCACYKNKKDSDWGLALSFQPFLPLSGRCIGAVEEEK
jgi:hypothetical protein